MKRRLQAWRPLTLCWAKPLRRAAPGIAHTTSHSIHLHRHSTTLNLHFAVSMQHRPERATAATLHYPAPTAVARPAGHTHTERRHLTLHRLRTDTSHVQRESTSTLARRVDRVHSFTTTNVVVPTQRVPEALAPSRVTSARAPEAAASPGPRRHAMMTLATPPKESRSAAPSQPTGKPMRAPTAAPSLVWSKAPTHAPEQVEDQSTADGASAPARSRPSAPASFTPAVAPLPAITAQQTREAVRANLLDSAVADRLAEDVIRRVEKRMRIERERRGL